MAGTNKKSGCFVLLGVVMVCAIFGAIGKCASGGNDSSSNISSLTGSSGVSSSAVSASHSTTSIAPSASSQDFSASSKSITDLQSEVFAADSSSQPAEKVSSAPVEVTAPETPTQTDNNSLVVTKEAGTVQAGSNATLSIQGKPNTSYSISVYYSTSVSSANGLEKKASDSSGNVTWTWKVSPNAKAGSHKIVIEGGGDKIQTDFTTTK